MNHFRFVIIAALITPFSFLPLSWSQAIGGWLGRNLLRFNKKREHIARRNIEACFPEKSDTEIEQLLSETAASTGKWFMEAPYVFFRNPESLKHLVTVDESENIFNEAYAKGKGVVIVLPHLGNWEFLNFYLPYKCDLASMYQPIKSPIMEEIILQSRSRTSNSLFSADPSGVRKALKHLKQGKVLVVLSDHLPSKKAGVYAPFFNIPAWTGKLTHSLAKNNDAEVILMCGIRKPNGKGFEARFSKIDGMNRDATEEAAAASMNKAIENAIRENPEQYQWVYRRFARPPEGYKNIYKD